MLSFAIRYRAIEQMTSERKNDLRQYELTEEEWVIASELSNTLKILKDATLYFSHASSNLPVVIPAMDHIDTYFTNAIKPSSGNNPAIWAGMGIVKKTLNRYYSLTDASETYRIAMGGPSFVLHPRHKLTYFKSAGWTDNWIKTAEKLVQNQFKHDYVAVNIEQEEACGSESGDSVHKVRNMVIQAVFHLMNTLGGDIPRKYLPQSSITFPSQIHTSHG
ncbi:hypothetical protein L208DRAFT_1244315 [Tricholoma matsutake]|nr:hypothetical protein L208DRAFT_1244315 [Tricholoma matsutake 945]